MTGLCQAKKDARTLKLHTNAEVYGDSANSLVTRAARPSVCFQSHTTFGGKESGVVRHRVPLRTPATWPHTSAPMLMRSPLARERRSPPGFIRPSLLTPATTVPTGPEWLHELKHDGMRVIIRKAVARLDLVAERPALDDGARGDHRSRPGAYGR